MTPTHVGDVHAATEGLPAKFVLSMRTLFDILDDKRTGHVKFSGNFISLSVYNMKYYSIPMFFFLFVRN